METKERKNNLAKSVLYERLKAIVGAENVTGKEVIMETYTATARGRRDRTEILIEKPKKPDFVSRPGNTEEVQEIVRLANEYKVPVIPMGAFTSEYAESVPLEGGIILDFSRMKHIEIDAELMTVTFEPGVTWADAYRTMTPLGYMASHQALPASVSILGSTTQAGTHLPLDKLEGPWGTSYYSDLTMGLEVVLPTGELLVTGSAALPGVKPYAPRAHGPNVAHIFLGAQGTLGIVTKQTLPLWRIPEARHMVQGNFKDDNFKGLTRASYRIFHDFYEGPIWAEQQWAIYDGTQEGKPFEWEYYVQLYGNKERVEFDRRFSEKIIKEEGGTIISSPRILEVETDYSPQWYEECIFWRPRANSIVNMPFGTRNLILGAAVSYDKTPEVHDAALNLLAKHGLTWSRIRKGILRTDIRSGIQIFSISYIYDLNDAEEEKRVKAINEEWREFLKVRPLPTAYRRLPPESAKVVMPMLGEYYELLKKLKRWLDPNRIMNPGKLMDLEPY